MNVIEKIRKDREDLARVLKKHSGIRKIVEDLYPDSAHFIYELLQNAEDKDATEASFSLSHDSLAFEHNGRPFDTQDIRGITDIGEGTKAGEDDKIGRFGVGFKAVFTYSDTPEIWSPTYSFKITDLVLPSEIKSNPTLTTNTRFRFPFNNPKKSCETAYNEIASGLNELAEHPLALLFLTNLRALRWRVDGIDGEAHRVQHSNTHFEVTTRIGDTPNSSSHYLKFEQPVTALNNQAVAVAFELGLLPKCDRFDKHISFEQQFRIVPATPGRVAVYFPAYTEVSGLRFHVHAPFVPELSRASIKDTPANDPLFLQLATLTAHSLHQVRDFGLLNAEFLAVIPNSFDSLPRPYRCIRTAILNEMRTQPLTPKYGGGHAPADHLLQAKASLKNLLRPEDLEFLITHRTVPCQWAIGATRKHSDVDRFLEGLAIEEWNIGDFAELICNRVGGWPIDEDFVTWLADKPLEWHQKLYAFLFREFGLEDGLNVLGQPSLVRMSDGNYTHGQVCFFPSDGIEHDEAHPRVDIGVFTAGASKSEQSAARSFLERMGVREVGEAEEVEALLEQRYSEESDTPDANTYRKDLNRFIKLVEDDPKHAELFEQYWIFQCEDGEWCQPAGAYLDRPFLDTGLDCFYKQLPDDSEGKRHALSQHYGQYRLSTKRLVQFAKAVGIETRLTITHQSTSQHVASRDLRKDRYDNNTIELHTRIDDDWWIPGLEQVLSHPSKQLASVVWRVLMDVEPRMLQARYRPNKKYDTRTAPSSFVLLLQNSEWIPQGRKGFCRPANASRKALPKGFEFDPEFMWLEAIGFGRDDANKLDERRQLRVMAKRLGFKGINELKRALRFTTLATPEEQERFVATCERKKTADEVCTAGSGIEARNRDGTGHKQKRDSDGTGTPDSKGVDRQAASKRTPAGARSRPFISYVGTDHRSEEPDPDGLDHSKRMKLEERGIRLILAEEPTLNRTPTNNPGFDLFEAREDGEPIRWIEVKTMTGCLQDRPVGMSHTQFGCASEHREAFWLYIVEYAGDDKKARIVRIQDPAGKARTFTFDHGWIEASEIVGTSGCERGITSNVGSMLP